MRELIEELRKRKCRFELIAHPRTFTSIEEALALGVAADEVLKSVIVETHGTDAVLVIPASRRLDMSLVRQALKDPHVRLATEEEITAHFPGTEPGAMHPIGSLFGVRTYVDPEVFEHERVLFATGVRLRSMRTLTKDLFRYEPIAVVALSKHPEESEEKDPVLSG
jgi:Ala-tRNA(Pro) deacylase